MTETSMTPMAEPNDFTPGSELRRPVVANWISIVSIVLGVLGLLCWGGQGVGMLMASGEPEMEMMSSSHLTAAAFDHVINTLLALVLLLAGISALNGSDGGLLRIWAWLKLLMVAAGVIMAFMWFDELVEQHRMLIEAEMQEAAASQEDVPEMDADTLASTATGLTVGVVAVASLIQVVWPLIVLVCVKGRRD